ncbi:type II secretion system protein GspK [Methylobacter sp.]|uniref:general secretion pathway protein GspK n=1 Tax=Methylobacter sp. TaxID=2051955 RepID=UPI002486F6C0|nr:type II secretion system protein GspK [Methylobacter sp.]MDI1276667.1 type II secretion system protein GspK [Methylobacter sp.]MDI1357336.1 type II secretion system protein GspK [Methylobacter sp.]
MIRPEGFALVLVLWVLSLLTIMAGSFALSMRREAGIVTGSSNNAQAAAIAESGLAVAELMLMHPDPLQRWHTDGSVYQLDYADSKVRVRLLSEAGKVDLNSADQTLLQGLMVHAPVDEQLQIRLVNAVLDWRDADDLVHIEGAEKEEYKDAGLSYGPRNKPFQSIEELQLVLGMNDLVFKWLENRVTVYSGQPQVDLTQASQEVLQVLPGMDPELINEYIAARRESAINGLPAPTVPVGSNRASGQTVENAPAAAVAVSNGAAQQGVMTVIAEALLNDGTTAVINTVIKKSDSPGASPFQVLKWQRNAAVDGSLFTDETDELLVRQYAEPEFNH